MIKNKRGLIIITLAAVVAFSGCTSQENKRIEETQFQGEEKIVEIPEIGNMSKEDNALVSAAIDTLDESLCEKISTSENREMCKKSIIEVKEDQIITEKTKEAVLSGNVALCQEIAAGSYRDICVARVNTGIKEQEEQEAAEASLQEESKKVQALVDAENLAGCEEVEDENWKSDCIFNITIGQATKEQDASICNRLTDENQKKRCSEAVDSIQ